MVPCGYLIRVCLPRGQQLMKCNLRPGLLLATGLAGASCHDSSSGNSQPVLPVPATAPSFTQEPFLEPNPVTAVPLAAVLTLETDRPTRVELGFDDGVRQWQVVASGYARRHERIPVLGMRPGREHRIAVVARDEGGLETAAPQPLIFTTPDLPVDFPPLSVTTSAPTEMEPGVTLLNTESFGQHRLSFVVIVDHEGEVVWYYDGNQNAFTQSQTALVHRAPNGSLLIVNGRIGLYEIDMLGNIQGLWLANRLAMPPVPAGTVMVDTDSMHHDVLTLPQGTGADFVVMSSERRLVL